MDPVTLAIGAVIVLSAVNVLTGWMLAWGLAGGDGEPSTPVAGIMGLVTAITAPATALVVLVHVPRTPRIAVVVVGVVAAATAAWWTARHPDGPSTPVWVGLGVTAVAVPLVLAATTTPGRPVRWWEVALATGPVLGALTALVLVRLGLEDLGEDGWSPAVVAAAGSLVAVPLVLAVLAA